jgi:hypothetical protein
LLLTSKNEPKTEIKYGLHAIVLDEKRNVVLPSA